jgi:hypothetical protein
LTWIKVPYTWGLVLTRKGQTRSDGVPAGDIDYSV